MKPVVLTCLAALLSVAALGCAAKKGTIEGTVTLDGEPLPKGSIQFYPTEGVGQSAGTLIIDGNYKTEASVGVNKVVINSTKVIRRVKLYDTPKSPMVDHVMEALPARYNARSELTVTVKSGTNTMNFELTSEPKDEDDPAKSTEDDDKAKEKEKGDPKDKEKPEEAPKPKEKPSK